MEHQQQYQQVSQAYYPPQEKPPGFVDQHQQAAYGQQYPQQYHDPNSTAAAQPQYPVHNGGHIGAAPAAPAQASGTGTKRGLLIGLIIAIALLLAIVIGLGAGLGVSQNHLHSVQSNLDAAQSSLSSAASAATTAFVTTTKTSSPSKTSSSSSATATADKFSTCPGANSTVYTSDTGNKTFTVHCGIDYSGKGQADDVNSTKAATMTVCMDACAKLDNCQGAGWGYISGSGNMCYMKTNLTKSHAADSNWEFATLNTSS